jgi:hypothetical protein
MLFSIHRKYVSQEDSKKMDVSRMLGIGVVMIIPSFVGSGLLWNILGSWIAILLWIIIMAVVYGGVLFKLSTSDKNSAH